MSENELRVAVRAFGQILYQDELSAEAWAGLLALSARPEAAEQPTEAQP